MRSEQRPPPPPADPDAGVPACDCTRPNNASASTQTTATSTVDDDTFPPDGALDDARDVDADPLTFFWPRLILQVRPADHSLPTTCTPRRRGVASGWCDLALPHYWQAAPKLVCS